MANLQRPSTQPADKMRKQRIAQMTEQQIGDHISKAYEGYLDKAQGDFRRWRMNSLFVEGNQWAVWSNSQNKIIQPKPPRGKVRITKNLIKPWALDTEAKYRINRPEMAVMPNTSHPVNKDAAKGGEAVGQHYWRALQMRWLNTIVDRYCIHFGDCLGLLDWDETIGPTFKEISRIFDASGERQEVTHTSMGDITLNILTPFNYFTDEMPGDLDKKFALYIVRWMTLEEIENTWEDGHKVQETKHLGPMRDAMEAAHAAGVRKKDSREGVPGSPVIQAYFRPQRAAKDGRVVTIGLGGNVTLHDDKWPAAFEKMEGFPAVQYKWYEHPLQFRPPAPVEDQMPLQREINISASQVAEARNLVTAIKILNPTGSGVRTFSDMNGQIINHSPGLAPGYMNPPSIPAFVFRGDDSTIASLEDVQMRHSASRGKVPPGVKSGVGILNLAEQDDRPISIPEAFIHHQHSLLFRKILQIASTAVEEERMVRYIGRNGRRYAQMFKGADLKDNFDIHVFVRSGGAKSESGVRAFYLESLKAGAFRDENGLVDTHKYLEIMRQSTQEVLYEEVDANAEIAQGFIDILEDPEQEAPFPAQWDDHRAILAELEDHMRDLSWRRRAQQNPVVFARFERFYVQLLSFINGQPPPELSGASDATSQPAGPGATT